MNCQVSSEHIAAKTSSISDIYHDLLDMYGPIMELGEVAKVLRRSRSAIRNAVNKVERVDSDSEYQPPMWAITLAGTKRTVGRKIMFRTKAVADLLELEGA